MSMTAAIVAALMVLAAAVFFLCMVAQPRDTERRFYDHNPREDRE
ncbi:hypothetical protein [uncultured Pseudacidovorax sp.]|nr:hypothetical protein [uncultured Pseudacidovorax sp.]